MIDFFPIETPYNSKDYEIMKNVVNMGIDSSLNGFVESRFTKSPNFNNKFLWNIHDSELPILYKRLEDLYKKTGDEDYNSFLEEVRSVSDKSMASPAGFNDDELEEMIDPYDPMDANQTITGEPTSTSDLAYGGVDTAGPGGMAPAPSVNAGIENYIDDDTIGQEMMAEEEMEISEAELKEMIRRELGALASEDSSDSLANQHGMNAKPQTMIDETTDQERYEDVVYIQGEEADEVMDILNNDGRDAAMNYLMQWHQPGNHMGRNELGHGTQDKTFEKDGYIMFWNPYLPYIGLTYDTQYETELAEDSQVIRHQQSQRGKIGEVPLGQHAPHSPHAKK